MRLSAASNVLTFPPIIVMPIKCVYCVISSMTTSNYDKNPYLNVGPTYCMLLFSETLPRIIHLWKIVDLAKIFDIILEDQCCPLGTYLRMSTVCGELRSRNLLKVPLLFTRDLLLPFTGLYKGKRYWGEPLAAVKTQSSSPAYFPRLTRHFETSRQHLHIRSSQ